MSRSTDTSGNAEIRVPRETINDDVVLVGWRVENGARVRAGEPLVDIETSKAVLELTAERDGYLEILCADGDEAAVGEVIGRILPEPATVEPPSEPATDPAAPAADGYVLSGKARRLVAEHGIDPAVFASQGLIREADVLLHLEGGGDEAEAEQLEATSPPLESPRTRNRGLLGDARAAARQRGHGLLWLAWNYFWRNWLLGNLVKVAPRGVIDVLHKMRGVKMGKDCFIDPSATLETAYPENITLGDDVRVTVGAIVMTHIKAPNYLRETGIMPVVLKPVVLEDHCFIGVNACIMPGVTVGKASVVASGAVVVADVPPFTMVAGNPARVIKRFARPEEAP